MSTRTLERKSGADKAERQDAIRRVIRSRAVGTQEELADHATDDLVEATGLDEERAKTLIMAARAPWFAENNA